MQEARGFADKAGSSTDHGGNVWGLKPPSWSGNGTCHGGNVWGAMQEFRLLLEEVLDFSANLNPLGPPESVLRLLREQADMVRHYPEPQSSTLKRALAVQHDVPARQLIVGNGAAELIYLLCRVLKPARALIPVPTFSEYERAVRAVGGEVQFFPLGPEADFALPLETLVRVIATGGYDLVVVCNPNNPTGTLTAREALVTLVRVAAQAGTFLLLDESFIGFLPDRGAVSLIGDVQDGSSNLFILNSLTKLYCLPGLRLGYGIGPEAIIKEMEGGRDPWSVNAPAQLAGLACLDEVEYVQKSVALMSEQRAVLFQGLGSIPGVKPYPSAANFLLCDLRASGITAPAARKALGCRGILIRDCSNFPGLDQYYARVAVRMPAENQRLLTELRAVLESPGKTHSNATYGY
ncbi:MAG: threonine-phosphate decarboxylase [Clostridia bacterium]|nr:threonine-phosphate decarboxylase [Clostridia bacterium]